MAKQGSEFWNSPLARTVIRSDEIRMPEMLIGYFIGPFGGLLASGIFTSMLQQYFTDVLKLNLQFLTGLQLISTIFIVIANLVVGQLIERTRTLAGKARPWILLSALTISVASVLMFVMPFTGLARMIWIAIAYNLYYAFAFPIYNTANSTLIPVSTRDSSKRGVLASFTNVAGLGVMGAGSMVFPVLVSFALKENQALWFVAMLAIAIFSGLTCVADGGELAFMKPTDISILFGNALDNALESVEKLAEVEKRLVHVSIARQKSFLRIRVENCYAGELHFTDGLPATGKDARYHGYGMKSIRSIVEKYNGSLTIKAQDGWFELRILIPVPQTPGIRKDM